MDESQTKTDSVNKEDENKKYPSTMKCMFGINIENGKLVLGYFSQESGDAEKIIELN